MTTAATKQGPAPHVEPAQARKSRYLTVDQALAELNEGIPEDERIARSTWQRWRATGKGPIVIRLPNGKLRIRRSDFDKWLASLEVKAA